MSKPVTTYRDQQRTLWIEKQNASGEWETHIHLGSDAVVEQARTHFEEFVKREDDPARYRLTERVTFVTKTLEVLEP